VYRKILVALENSRTDETILRHIEPLARMHGSELLLVHVADGWVARHRERLNLAESEEMRLDRAYLEEVRARLVAEGLVATAELSCGEPADEIVRLAEEQGVDLIAMSTHGHRFLADLIYGSTVHKVRHTVTIPVLLLKAAATAPRPADPPAAAERGR
jgi:nucleotide-binding universal stress UspA family protein